MSFADTIKTYAPGFKGKLMFDVMPWMSDGKVHRVSRYSSIDPAVIANQLALVKLAGGAGIRVTWEGPSPTYAFSHQATMELCNQCAEQGLLFSLIINPQVNGQANWWLDPGFLAMVNSPAYIPEKFLCDFSTGIDYTKVALPPGFSVLMNQKGFGWANAYDASSSLSGAVNYNALTLSQIQDTNKTATMKWPFLTNGFQDAGYPLPAGVKPTAFTGSRDYAHSVWTSAKLARAIDHEAGNFFLDCVAALLLCPTAPYCGMVWNDADEGAGCEHFLSAFFGIRIGK